MAASLPYRRLQLSCLHGFFQLERLPCQSVAVRESGTHFHSSGLCPSRPNARFKARYVWSALRGVYFFTVSVIAFIKLQRVGSVKSSCVGVLNSLKTGSMSHELMTPISAARTMQDLASSSFLKYCTFISSQTVSVIRNSFSRDSTALAISSVNSNRLVWRRLMTVVPPNARFEQTMTLIPAVIPALKLLSCEFLIPIERIQSELEDLFISITPKSF